MQSIRVRSMGCNGPRRASVRRRTWRSEGQTEWLRRGLGIGMAIVSVDVVIRTLPWLIWPVGMGLWLFWAGLGPLALAGALVWVGWKISRQQ